MQTIQRPWIKLMETIGREDYELISGLEKACMQADGIALKLELDYKLCLQGAAGPYAAQRDINELMYFDGDTLIGYIGIGSFGPQPEVNGMVHPDYRGQGVFTALHRLMLAELNRRGVKSALLLSDGKARDGLKFIEKTGAIRHHSEYEMFLRNEGTGKGKVVPGVTFRKAVNSDANEIARQNAIYFGEERGADEDAPQTIPVLPEEEEKRGMTMYLAYVDGQAFGKVNVQLGGGAGGIYGLGVMPEYRGRGLGRTLLLFGVERLREMGAGEIFLQVATQNANALHIYESCGFEVTSTMEYFELAL